MDQTRTALLDAAEQLFISDGYAATSQDAIASAARFTKGALYRHFANKEAVFLAVFERVERAALDVLIEGAAVTTPTWDGAIAALGAYLDLTTTTPFRRIVLEEGPAVLGWTRWRELDEQLTGAPLRATVEQLHQAGAITVEDPALIARLVCALVAEAALGMSRPQADAETRARSLRALEKLFSGLRT